MKILEYQITNTVIKNNIVFKQRFGEAAGEVFLLMYKNGTITDADDDRNVLVGIMVDLYKSNKLS